MDEFGQEKYITTLDLATGYWQGPVNLQDQEKTAFSSPLGLFWFKKMPFGLSGVPGTFQRLMDRVINRLSFTKAYLDDLVIYSSTWQEHLPHGRTDISTMEESRINYQAKKMPISYGRVHLPWTCDWKRNHKTGN